jgi:hypothetical protein
MGSWPRTDESCDAGDELFCVFVFYVYSEGLDSLYAAIKVKRFADDGSTHHVPGFT